GRTGSASSPTSTSRPESAGVHTCSTPTTRRAGHPSGVTSCSRSPSASMRKDLSPCPTAPGWDSSSHMTSFDVHQHLWPEQLIAALRKRSRTQSLDGDKLILGEGTFQDELD